MTQVKNSGVEMLTVHRAAGRKQADNKADSVSGFKTMLRDKHHKSKPDRKSTSESNKDETAGAENAAQLLAHAKPKEQSPEELSGNVQKLIKELPVGNAETGKGQKPAAEKIGKFYTLNMSIDQLKTDKVTASFINAQPLKEALNAGLTLETEVLDPQMPHKKSGNPMSAMEELLKQNKVLKEQNPILDSAALKVPNAKNMTEEAALNPQSKKTGNEQVMLEEEKKKPEESLGIIQEKSHESKHTQHIQPKEALASQVTVKAENAKELEANLSDQIIKQIHTGKKELEVQLDPQNLGKIHIKVSYEENQVSVSVVCSENKTLKMLSHSAGDLGNILESNIERPVQIFVDKQEANYLNNQQEQGNGGQQQQQHQESRQEEKQEDFIQKLRLGILESDSTDDR